MTRIQNRRGTSTQWTTANPILASGEKGFEIDTGLFKMGDGVSSWNQLPYFLDQEASDTRYALKGAGGGSTFSGNADDLEDGATKVVMTKLEREKLSGVAANATNVSLPTAASQEEAEAGELPTVRSWSPLRIAQAVRSLAAEISGSAESITTGQLAVDRLPIGAPLTVDKAKAFYGAAGSWPTSRPTARTDICIEWLGDTDPGNIAIAGDKIELVG